MPNPLTKETKTLALYALIVQYTGEAPTIKRYDTYNQILLTQSQNKKLENVLDNWWSKDPSDVRINVAPIILPVIIKKYWGWAAGVFGLGTLIGIGIARR